MTIYRKIWGILYFVGIIGVLIFFISQPSSEELCLQQYKNEKNVFYNGVVTNKYLDSLEHNYKTIILNNHKTLWMNWDESGLYEFVQPFDSIVKNSGSYEVKLFRDSMRFTFTIDYGCENMAQKIK